MNFSRILFLVAWLFLSLAQNSIAQNGSIESQINKLLLVDSDSADWLELEKQLPKDSEWRYFVQGNLASGSEKYQEAKILTRKFYRLVASKNDFAQLVAANRMSAILTTIKQTDSIQYYSSVCIQLSGENYPFYKGHCLLHLGTEQRKENDFEKSIKNLRKALKIFQKNGLEDAEGFAVFSIGNYYQFQSILDSSVHYFLEAIKIFEKTNNQHQLSKVYNNMALAQMSLNDLKSAKRYVNKSIGLRHKANDIGNFTSAFSTLGNIYIEEQKWDSARAEYQIVQDYYQGTGNKQGMLWSENNIANVNYYAGDFQKAFESFSFALKLAEELNDSIELCRINSNLGWSYISLGKINESKAYFDKGLEIALRINSLEQLEQAYTGLADYYIAKEDYKQALSYYEKARNTGDKLLNENRLKQIAEMQTKYETEKKENEIIRLDKENVEANLALSTQQGWLVGTILTAVLLLVFAAFVYVLRKRKSEYELAQKEIEFRKNLIEATVAAEEMERQRIAKDMHDGLVQTLAAIKMGLQSFGRKAKIDAELNADFEAKVKMVDEAADEARNISHQMMPRALTEAGLVSALDDMLAKTLGNSEITYSFEHFGIGEERFKQSIEIGLYRIAQELINNIIKHSKASTVQMQLIKTKTHVILHVEDDGLGFKPSSDSSKNGMGMNNILSRASAVNGEVNYENGSPKGTVANVRIPLE